MGELRNINGQPERRRESRTEVCLPLTVWGVDCKGERFLLEAQAHDISLSGAMLTGLDTDLSSGDVVGILYAGRKARFRVVWVRYDASGEKMQVAVHRNPQDECPWQDVLAEGPRNGSSRAEVAPPPDDPLTS